MPLTTYTQTTKGRGARAALFVLLVSLGIVAATGSPAQAAIWDHPDGFETNPAGTWELFHDKDGGGGFDLSAGTARTGTNNAFLSVRTGFSSVGKQVFLQPAQLHKPTCGAAVHVQALGGAKVLFEIIDPANWTWVTVKEVTLNGGGYTRINTDSWKPGPAKVVVRVSLIGNGGFSAARVDDLTVRCQFF